MEWIFLNKKFYIPLVQSPKPKSAEKSKMYKWGGGFGGVTGLGLTPKKCLLFYSFPYAICLLFSGNSYGPNWCDIFHVWIWHFSFAQPRLFVQLPCTFNMQTSLQVCGFALVFLKSYIPISNSPSMATNSIVNLTTLMQYWSSHKSMFWSYRHCEPGHLARIKIFHG